MTIVLDVAMQSVTLRLQVLRALRRTGLGAVHRATVAIFGSVSAQSARWVRPEQAPAARESSGQRIGAYSIYPSAILSTKIPPSVPELSSPRLHRMTRSAARHQLSLLRREARENSRRVRHQHPAAKRCKGLEWVGHALGQRNDAKRVAFGGHSAFNFS